MCFKLTCVRPSCPITAFCTLRKDTTNSERGKASTLPDSMTAVGLRRRLLLDASNPGTCLMMTRQHSDWHLSISSDFGLSKEQYKFVLSLCAVSNHSTDRYCGIHNVDDQD